MRLLSGLIAAAMTVGSGLPVLAATLQTKQGSVLVNKGSGFVKVTGAAELRTGDTVMANPGSKASVVYLAGCIVVVQSGTVYTVQPEDHCALGLTNASVTPYVVGAGVVAGAVSAGVLLSQKGNRPASP